MLAGRSTVRRVRWMRGGRSPASPDPGDGLMIRGGRRRKPAKRSVVVASGEGVLGPMWSGLKFTAAIVPPWVPVSKSVRACDATDSLTKVAVSRARSRERYRGEDGCQIDPTSYRPLTAAILCNVAEKNYWRRAFAVQ